MNTREMLDAVIDTLTEEQMENLLMLLSSFIDSDMRKEYDIKNLNPRKNPYASKLKNKTTA